MAYLALYREWRPQSFGAIVAQDHITKTLQNAVQAGRTGHAYLFCGSRGTGKTSTAKVLAKALNCLDRNGPEPCNRCTNCQAITDGLSVDVIEVDAASNRGIDEIRDLREKVKFAPTTGPFRVYIIDEVHMLTNEAFNALLKTLEEPPRHIVFILATTEPHKLPLTILSRCQRFDFRRIPPDEIIGRLKEVVAEAGLEAEEDALRLIARAAEGGLRDALSILDQGAALGEMRVTAEHIHNILGTVRVDLLNRMAGHLAAGESGQALRLAGELTGMGKDLRLFAREMAAYLRALVLYKLLPDAAPDELWGDEIKNTAAVADFSEERLIRAVDILIKAEQEMKTSSMPGIILELALVKACRPEISVDLSSLAARVETLEEKLNHPAPEKSGVLPAGTGVAGNVPGRRKVVARRLPERQERQPVPDGNGLAETPVTEATADAVAEVGLDQVRASWGEIVEALRTERPLLYSNYRKAVPLKTQEHILIVGFPEGEDLALGMAERPENKIYFEELLNRFLSGKWQVVNKYYQGKVNLPAAGAEPANEISRRFKGKEVIPEDGPALSLFDDE